MAAADGDFSAGIIGSYRADGCSVHFIYRGLQGSAPIARGIYIQRSWGTLMGISLLHRDAFVCVQHGILHQDDADLALADNAARDRDVSLNHIEALVKQ